MPHDFDSSSHEDAESTENGRHKSEVEPPTHQLQSQQFFSPEPLAYSLQRITTINLGHIKFYY